jgi:hypothetical protein
MKEPAKRDCRIIGRSAPPGNGRQAGKTREIGAFGSSPAEFATAAANNGEPACP